ncbi:MAG: peptide/nickel transport system permease protein [Thermomicrobiales bacterium]|nr:peptide/nickel transport system permease protein [Thermomicrobiales bacterium]
MSAYIAQRTLQMVVVVFGVVTVTFFAVRLVPGDPARLMEQPGTPESVLKLTRERLGTDKPLSEQYVRFLGDFVRGDLGTAFRGGQPVRSEVLSALPNTLALGAVTMILTTTLSFLIGIAAANRPAGVFDRISLVFVAIAQSTPSFWLGVILVLVFSIRLRWLPAIDMTGPKSFVLPTLTLTLTLMPLLIRAVRQSFLETLGEGFIRAGRARGLSERRLLFVHAMKVAAIPLITLVGLQAGYVLGGAVVIESIFNWPGIGNLALQAIQQRDFPMVQGTVLAIAVVFTLVNFLVDLTYSALDPRVKY